MARRRLLPITGRISYWWHLLWRGWWKPVVVIIAAISFYDLILGQFIPSLPTVTELINSKFPVFSWRIWIFIFLALVLLAVLEGAYRAEQNCDRRIHELEARLSNIENSHPKILWGENHYEALYQDPRNPGTYVGHVLQIWFKNQPVLATEDSEARDVTATVSFYNIVNNTKLMTIPGCFIIAEALDYAGNTGKREEVITRWAANDEPHKLQVAIKRKQDDNAFGYGMGADVSSKQIQKGKYYVLVEFKGTRLIEPYRFWFELENLGAKQDLVLSNQITPPDLNKEGSQP